MPCEKIAAQAQGGGPQGGSQAQNPLRAHHGWARSGKKMDLKGPERRFPMNFRPRLRHMATVKLREKANFDFTTARQPPNNPGKMEISRFYLLSRGSTFSA